LLKNAGIAEGDISRVYLAGGLGDFIDSENALRTGLLPAAFKGRIRAAGNLSLEGAALSLLRPAFIDECSKLRERCRLIDLAREEDFMDSFADAMSFSS
jgi:uncharacterized 2Fe-2S/4Fe-4S cluster protein (DUF4445 family)